MGWTPCNSVVWAGARSHIALNLRRPLWKIRRKVILELYLNDMLSLPAAQQALQAQLIPNPRRQGGMVFRHTPLAMAAAAYRAAQPDWFADWFLLPGYDQFVLLADIIGLPATVRCDDGCVAPRADALLVWVMRAHNEGSWKKLAQHPVVSGPGSNWSETKLKIMFRTVSVAIHRAHGRRATWSKCCMGRHAMYAAKLHARMPPTLNAHFAGLGVVVSLMMDGTRRAVSRAIPAVDGTDLQRQDWNHWWHGHNNLFITMSGPDGLFAACSGPHHGNNNDQGATNAANVVPAINANLPAHVRVVVDDGFAGTNGPGPLVGAVPGGPFSNNCSDPRDRYNADMRSLRNSVELPYGALTSIWPCLELGHNRTRASTTTYLNYRNCVIVHNVLLCMGQGHAIIGSMFDCPPPSIDDYLGD